MWMNCCCFHFPPLTPRYQSPYASYVSFLTLRLLLQVHQTRRWDSGLQHLLISCYCTHSETMLSCFYQQAQSASSCFTRSFNLLTYLLTKFFLCLILPRSQRISSSIFSSLNLVRNALLMVLYVGSLLGGYL